MPNDLRVAKVAPLHATSSSRSLLGAVPGSYLLRVTSTLYYRGSLVRGPCVMPHSLCRSGHGTVDCIPSVPQLQGAAERRACNEHTSVAHSCQRWQPQTHLAHLFPEVQTWNGRCCGDRGGRSGRNARSAESHLTKVRRRGRLRGVSRKGMWPSHTGVPMGHPISGTGRELRRLLASKGVDRQ